MWLPLFNGVFEGSECSKNVHIILHNFANFGFQVGECFCAMKDFANWSRIETVAVSSVIHSHDI